MDKETGQRQRTSVVVALARHNAAIYGLSESPVLSGPGVSSKPRIGRCQRSEVVDVAYLAAPAAKSLESGG